MSHSYKKLVVWQKAKALAVETYRLPEKFPRSELYGLTSQLRRATVSVVSNIAEGQGRLTKADFVLFLGHSRGSLLEAETQFAIALDLGFVLPADREKVEQQTSEVLRLLNGLLDSLRSKGKAAGA